MDGMDGGDSRSAAAHIEQHDSTAQI